VVAPSPLNTCGIYTPFSLLKHLYLTLSKYLPKPIIRVLLAHRNIFVQATSYVFSHFLFNNFVIQFLAVTMEASHCSETLQPIYQTARRHVSFSHLCVNVKSYRLRVMFCSYFGIHLNSMTVETKCCWKNTLLSASQNEHIVSVFRGPAYFLSYLTALLLRRTVTSNVVAIGRWQIVKGHDGKP
jgi:hypothetical protein